MAIKRLTDTGACESQPDWSPDGANMVFVRDGDIWTMAWSGDDATMIAVGGHSPTWAPDGTLIAFVDTADGAIHTVPPTGTNDTLFADPVAVGNILDLDWEPR